MDPLPILGKLILPPEDLTVRFARSGGPGGQNVNKVETKVELRFSLATSAALSDSQRELLMERLAHRLTKDGVMIITASEHRERGRNMEAARTRMANVLRAALKVQRKRKPTKPTRGSQRRRLEAKKQRSNIKRMRGKRGSSED